MRATRERRRRIRPNPPYVLDARQVEEIVHDVVRKAGRPNAPAMMDLVEAAVGYDEERCLAVLYMGEPSDPLTLGGETIDDVKVLLGVLAHRQIARMATLVINQHPLDLVSFRRPTPLTIDQYRDAVEAFAALARRAGRGSPEGYATAYAFGHPLVEAGTRLVRPRSYPYRAIDVLHVSERRNALFEWGEGHHPYVSDFDRCNWEVGQCVRVPAAAALLADTLAELKGFAPRYPVP